MANAPACFKLSLFFSEEIAPELRTVIFERLGSDTNGCWQKTIRTAKTEKSDDSSLHFLWKQGTQGWVLALLDYRLNGKPGQGLRRYEGIGSSSACGVIDKQQWLIAGFGAEQNSDRQFAQQIFKIHKGVDSRTTFQINSNFLPPSSVRFFMGNSTKELPPQQLRELAKKLGAQWQPHRQNEGSVAVGTAEKTYSQPTEPPSVAEGPSTVPSVAAEMMVKTAVAFPAPPLRHLDSPVGDFEGRRKENDILISRLSNVTQVGIGMIDGMPGVGKTQLALRVARELGHQYCGHQLIVRLHSGGGKPSDPRDALSKVVRSLKSPGVELPPDLDDLRQMYLHALSGTKSLIFVDNASESSEVEPLVPPDGCAMVVTSRATLALHRDVSVRVHLDELLPDQASILLTKICSRTPLAPDIAEKICRYCGYLPLAIRASGNLLDTTFGLDPAGYAIELEDEHHRLERIGSRGVPIGVEASFNLSYARLPEATGKAFQALAVFPGSFDALAEAVVCGDPKNEHLRILVQQALVNGESATGRYVLHDLMRLFAVSILGSNYSQTAKRHAEHFASVFERAEQLFTGDENAIRTSSELFSQEEANILAGWRWCATKSSLEKDAAALCCRFAEAGGYLVGNCLHPDNRLELYEASLEAARSLGAPKTMSTVMRRLARAHYDSGKNLGRSTHLLEQSLEIARKEGSIDHQSSALTYLGRNQMREGNKKQALASQLEARRLAEEAGDPAVCMLVVGHLGSTYIDIGDPVKAIECYNISLQLARSLKRPRNEAIALGGLGRAYHRLENEAKAVEFLEEAIQLAERIGDLKTVNTNALNLGRVFLKSDPARALPYFRRSLELNQEQGNRKREGGASFDIGLTLIQLGDENGAEKAFRVALEIAREVSHRLGEGKALEQLAELFSHSDPQEAVILGEAAMNAFRESEPWRARRFASRIYEWRRSAANARRARGNQR